MTPLQRSIATAFDVPPHMLASYAVTNDHGYGGAYANARQIRDQAANRFATAGRWLCPARDTAQSGRCLKPLPCGDHGVSDHLVGRLLYGDAYLATSDARTHYAMYADGTVRQQVLHTQPSEGRWNL